MKKSLRDKEDVKFFFRFLKSKGLFMKYRKELFKQKDEEAIEMLFEKHHGTAYFEHIIDYSFCWSATEDGHNFWSALNKEFSRNFYKFFSGHKSPENFEYLFKDFTPETCCTKFSTDGWIIYHYA